MSGDEQRTDIPAIADNLMQKLYLSSAYPYNNYNYSSARVAKGDFIRLKSLSINYEPALGARPQEPRVQARRRAADGQGPLADVLGQGPQRSGPRVLQHGRRGHARPDAVRALARFRFLT